MRETPVGIPQAITITAMIVTATTMRMVTTRTVTTMMRTAITFTVMTMTMTITIMVEASMLTRSTERLVSEALSSAEGAALYRLLTWLSPAFPVGAFAYSGGIEWAVEAGDIRDMPTLRNWLGAMLSEGQGFCDAIFLVHAYRAASCYEQGKLSELAELAAAFVPSRERQLETLSQGRAFMDTVRAAWNCPELERLIAGFDDHLAYPVAVGMVGAAHALPLGAAVHAFLHALVSNWISAGARLIPLGQTDSQRLVVALEQDVVAVGDRALHASLDDLGSATFRADLASLRHETQYTRLFRS